MDVEELFKFYRESFVPAYSDLVTVFLGEKPEKIVVEIENTLSHISQFHNPYNSQEEKEKNIQKAYNHLLRGTLDCYKLICTKTKEKLEEFLAYNRPGADLVRAQYSDFMEVFSLTLLDLLF